MCWQCENPGATRQDYLRQVVQPIVARCGWMVQAVSGDRLHAPVAYTIGLTASGLPELVVTGLRDDRAAALLNAAAEHLLARRDPVVAGERLHLHGRCLEVVVLPHPDAHLLVAEEVYGPALRGAQLVWSDDRGGWPWDRSFRSGRGGQPVLGPRGPMSPAAP